MNKIILLLALISQLTLFAQQSSEKKVRDTLNISSINSVNIKEAAKYSQKKNTLLFTFASWCEPCHLHLPTAIKLAKDYDLDLYVVIIDPENSEGMNYCADYIYALDKSVKVAVLSDATYGVKPKKRNKQFITEMTPPQFENISDFSKYIVINKQGEVIMVTTWKDNKGDWRDDTKMVNERIVPLLQ